MLTVSSYMDKRSAKLKLEALGHIRVALTGSPPNCFYSLMEDIFGYKDVQQGTPSSSTQQPVPSTAGNLPLDPQAFLTIPDTGSGSETIGAHGPRPSLPNPWGSEGWLKHTREVHKNTPPVPATYGQERPPSPQDIIKEAMDAYKIAT